MTSGEKFNITQGAELFIEQMVSMFLDEIDMDSCLDYCAGTKYMDEHEREIVKRMFRDGIVEVTIEVDDDVFEEQK